MSLSDSIGLPHFSAHAPITPYSKAAFSMPSLWLPSASFCDWEDPSDCIEFTWRAKIISWFFFILLAILTSLTNFSLLCNLVYTTSISPTTGGVPKNHHVNKEKFIKTFILLCDWNSHFYQLYPIFIIIKNWICIVPINANNYSDFLWRREIFSDLCCF